MVQAIFSEPTLTFALRAQSDSGSPISWPVIQVPSYGLYEPQGPTGNWASVGFKIGARDEFQILVPHSATAWDLGGQLAHVFQRHLYRFSAERLKVGRSPHGTNELLNQDASNLPEVLNQLQHNPERFRDLNKRLSTILPQVKHVSVRAIPSNQVEIVVWPHDPGSRREDLTVPLAESGTGIGQVLAILYVVLTSERAQVIIIDEPQSFLHPGAARKLIEFLKLHPQHQYIIATHSATIISAADPRTITLARYADCETKLEQLDARTERNVQAVLSELGVRLADSFGADDILWVEGRTEEKCFPLIVQRIMGRSLLGTEILGIRQTGDLEARDAKKVFEIYRSLSKGNSLLPPALAFVLDDECRREAIKRDLEKLSDGLALFLPRRMYENYLLNPEAIASVCNAVPGFRATAVTSEEVQSALNAKLADASYYCHPERVKNATDRIKNMDGARVLREIFSELSDTRVSYEKVLHGLALTEWLVTNAPKELEEVVRLLSKALDRGAVGGALSPAAPAKVAGTD